MVFVSHRLEEVIEIADRVTVMRDGRKVGTWPARELDVRRIGELMTGPRIDTVVSARDRSARAACAGGRGLTRRGEYEDVSFAVRRGEIVGLTGLLGAGRTELALSLFGMTRAGCGHDPASMDSPIDIQSNQAGDPCRHRAMSLRTG